MYRKSKHQKFFEEDITDFSRERLKRIAYLLVFNPAGYKDYIDDLQMTVIDGRIIVSGWATLHRWRIFTHKLFDVVSYDHVCDRAIERYYKSIGYGK